MVTVLREIRDRDISFIFSRQEVIVDNLHGPEHFARSKVLNVSRPSSFAMLFSPRTRELNAIESSNNRDPNIVGPLIYV